MALATCSVRVISRGKGLSSVAAAAYRAGEHLHNAYDGQIHNYTRKQGIVYSEILVPAGAPEWAYHRSDLWNKVEETERRKDARLAREVLIALPCELSREQNIELAKTYAQTFVRQGMVADVSIHDSRDGNPHAHILLTTRPLEGADFSKKKNPEWNAVERVVEWRKEFERITNDSLARYGHEERICVDSYAKQGIDKIPTVHLGTAAYKMEQKGVRTERGDINREIGKANRELAELGKELASLQKELEQELAQEEVLPHFQEDTTKPDGREEKEDKEIYGRLGVGQVSPPQPEPLVHHVRQAHGLQAPEHGLPDGSPSPHRQDSGQEPERKAPPLPHRHPVGRTWAQHHDPEPGQQGEESGRTHPPPLRRSFGSRSLAQQHRAAQEPERQDSPEPAPPHHPRTGKDPMRRMVSAESGQPEQQYQAKSDKLPEKEQEHHKRLPPPVEEPDEERRLHFRRKLAQLKKEHLEQQGQGHSRDSPEREK